MNCGEHEAKSAARSFGLALARFCAVLIAATAGLTGAAWAEEDPAPCGPFDGGPTGIVELAADRTLHDPGVQALAAADNIPSSAMATGATARGALTRAGADDVAQAAWLVVRQNHGSHTIQGARSRVMLKYAARKGRR